MVEASAPASKLKLVIGQPSQPLEQNAVSVQPQSVELLLASLQAKSVASVESASIHGQPAPLPETLASNEAFWRNLFSALTEGGTIQAALPRAEGLHDKVQSLLKMHGFSDVQFSNPTFDQGNLAVIARKAAFKSGGTSLNRKKKAAQPAAEENPWASLPDQGVSAGGQINEDELMADEAAVKAVTSQFAGECDRIMPGKPCENCTCGKKELQEGKITAEQLETGQVESSCGKCYLGDAFRCAGCPFRGKPAFEPGDKVKLQGADTTNAANDAAFIKADEVTTAQTGSTKVVLEL